MIAKQAWAHSSQQYVPPGGGCLVSAKQRLLSSEQSFCMLSPEYYGNASFSQHLSPLEEVGTSLSYSCSEGSPGKGTGKKDKVNLDWKDTHLLILLVCCCANKRIKKATLWPEWYVCGHSKTPGGGAPSLAG